MCHLRCRRGISAAVHGRPASVLVTDLNVETMANLAHNVEINRHRYSKESQVRVAAIDLFFEFIVLKLALMHRKDF